MSIPLTTQLPAHDEARIRSLLKALASGMILPTEFAERVYHIGSHACYRAAAQQVTEPEAVFDLSRLEKVTISRALAKCNGKKLEAARLLGIGKTTLYRKIVAYGIDTARAASCPACGHQLR